MGNFFKSLAHTVGELLTSKKFLTGALTAGAAMFVKDPTIRTHVVAVGSAVILGQGAADWGKSAAGVQAGKP